jgi:hypothetical protein
MFFQNVLVFLNLMVRKNSDENVFETFDSFKRKKRSICLTMPKILKLKTFIYMKNKSRY